MHTTQDLLKLAAAYMTPNYAPPPFVIECGQGVRLWDIEGREYLDFAGGIGVNALGNAHPKVVQAIAEQATKVCHTSNTFYNRCYIELCSRIGELAFGPRVYLSNSGTEATEAALKLARRYFYDRGQPERTAFVATLGSFHGRTYGALSVTGQETYQKGFGPLLPGVSHVPFNDLEAMRTAIGPHTAAVILEPIQGNGGVMVPQAGYLRGVRELCDQAGCLLIFDEIQTGIGRTGKWFAYEHEGVKPDIMLLAKALGGGLPLGAMVTTTELATPFQPGVHASTFGGNPVACAAGLATLEVIAQEGLLEHATAMGAHFKKLLGQLASQRSQITELRGRGVLIGIVFDRPIKELQASCRKRGLLTTAAGNQVLRLFPPLNVTVSELQQATELLDQAIKDWIG